MTDIAKVRAILDAATPRPWAVNSCPGGDDCWQETPHQDIYHDDGDGSGMGIADIDSPESADARAIIVSRNLAPALLAVAEAAESWAHLCHDYDLNVIGQSEMARLRAALDALDAEVEKL